MRSSFLRLSHRVSSNLSHAPTIPSLQPVPAHEHSDSYYEATGDSRAGYREVRQEIKKSLSTPDNTSSTCQTDKEAEHKQTNKHKSPTNPPRSTTADSSFASTSKQPFPFPPPSSSCSSCTPSPSLPPTTTSLLLSSISTSLPTSEPTFFHLLRRIHSTFPSLSATWFYHLHSSSPQFYHLTSSRTYGFLLELAFGETNLRLVETILGDLRERNNHAEGGEGRLIKWDRDLGRVLLRGYRKLGMEEEWREVLGRMEQSERTNGNMKGEMEWIVQGRSTERISLGSKGKGKAREDQETFGTGTRRGGEGVGWKGWKVRTRDIERARIDRTQGSEGTSVVEGGQKPRTKKKRLRTALPTVVEPKRKRPIVLIPPQPERLSSTSLSQLVQLLVHDQRTDDAFSLAETWLLSNRPSPSPVTRESITLAHKYNSTLFVLLNILLKPLLLSRSSIPTLLSFSSAFVARHSLPAPLPQPRPPLSTIRELLSGLTGRRNSWRMGKRIVDHFGYKWGLPLGDRGFENHAEMRLNFEEPTCGRWRRYLCLGDSEGSTKKEMGPQDWRKFRPHRFVPPSLAILLLRLAIESQQDPIARLDASDLERFRLWWKFVKSREPGSDYFRGSRYKGLILKAEAVGLLESSLKGKRRREWWLNGQRLVSQRKKRVKMERQKLGKVVKST